MLSDKLLAAVRIVPLDPSVDTISLIALRKIRSLSGCASMLMALSKVIGIDI